MDSAVTSAVGYMATSVSARPFYYETIQLSSTSRASEGVLEVLVVKGNELAKFIDLPRRDVRQRSRFSCLSPHTGFALGILRYMSQQIMDSFLRRGEPWRPFGRQGNVNRPFVSKWMLLLRLWLAEARTGSLVELRGDTRVIFPSLWYVINDDFLRLVPIVLAR